MTRGALGKDTTEPAGREVTLFYRVALFGSRQKMNKKIGLSVTCYIKLNAIRQSQKGNVQVIRTLSGTN